MATATADETLAHGCGCRGRDRRGSGCVARACAAAESHGCPHRKSTRSGIDGQHRAALQRAGVMTRCSAVPVRFDDARCVAALARHAGAARHGRRERAPGPALAGRRQQVHARARARQLRHLGPRVAAVEHNFGQSVDPHASARGRGSSGRRGPVRTTASERRRRLLLSHRAASVGAQKKSITGSCESLDVSISCSCTRPSVAVSASLALPTGAAAVRAWNMKGDGAVDM